MTTIDLLTELQDATAPLTYDEQNRVHALMLAVLSTVCEDVPGGVDAWRRALATAASTRVDRTVTR